MKKSERTKKMESNETTRLIKKIANDHGYEAVGCYVCSYGKPEVDIVAKDRGFHSFYPQIYLRGHWEFQRQVYVTEGFEIQTTSYGALDVKDYKEMLEVEMRALEMVEELNKVDLFGLEKVPEKFDDDEE